MVVALSYFIALLLTFAIAILLYPISAFFWVLGLLGKISDNLFAFTNKVIRSLWKDIKNSDKSNLKQWTCSCGCVNTGKFCSECGKPNIVIENPEKTEISE